MVNNGTQIKYGVQEALKIWTGIIALPMILVFMILLSGTLQDVYTGLQDRVALDAVREIRGLLLKTKSMALQHDVGANKGDIKDKVKNEYTRTKLELTQYISHVKTNHVLFNEASELIAGYDDWFGKEYAYLNRYPDNKKSSLDIEEYRSIVSSSSTNDNLFLNVIRELSDSENLLQAGINNGLRGMYVLQGSSILILVYFILVIAYFKKSRKKYYAKYQSMAEILNSIADAVIVTDIHGKVSMMNPEAERLTGVSYEDAKNSNLSDVFRVVNESGGKVQKDIVEKIAHDGNVIVYADDAMLLNLKGNRYQIYESGAPVFDENGAIIGVVLVFRDITREHDLKRQLLHHSRRIQRVIDSSMDAVIVVDSNDIVTEWNPAAEHIFGWSRGEVIGGQLGNIVIPEKFRDSHRKGIARLINAGDRSAQSKRIKSSAMHKNGNIFPIEISMVSIYTEEGWVFNAYIRDLTEQNKNEENIHMKNALLNQVQHIAKLGYWEKDHGSDELIWSAETYSIFCVDPDAAKPTYDQLLGMIHPDDREDSDKTFKESLKSKKPYSHVHRIITRQGAKTVHALCETEYENDNPVRSIGVVQDITEQTDAINELRLSATMFKTHAGILITDKDGTIIRVNPAFEKMTGYLSAELIGKNPRILQSGIQGPEFYNNLWREVSINGVWEGELWNRKKDGSLYAEWLTITAVRNDDGEIVNYVGTSQDITERKEAESAINYLANHDDLTDLANRRLLKEKLAESVEKCKQETVLGAVLMLDLDGFKDINDALGHIAGDEVLCQVSARLKSISDENSIVARMGGDEFVILLPSLSSDLIESRHKAHEIADNIHRILSGPYQLKNGQCYTSASIGIALFPDAASNIDDILKHVDTALYRAKDHKHDVACFYTPNMQVEVNAKLTIADGLREAIKNNEFILHYQSQVDGTGSVFGAEALLRWEHSEKGTILPDEFIPIAESTGLIVDIGNWVIHEAVSQISKWRSAGYSLPNGFKIAVNVSTRQFRQQYFVENFLDILEEFNVPAECIELEITESLLLDDFNNVISKMMVLRSRGIRVSIDDFGTGYSSLSYLTQLPIDQLKIDKSFVNDLLNDQTDVVVVETIIAMAKHLGLNVIAEGVENNEQLQFLEKMGCNHYQGYYFSYPVCADAFLNLLQKK